MDNAEIEETSHAYNSGSSELQMCIRDRVRTSDDEIFKSLVVTRLYHPGSKLKTLSYMAYFMNKYYDEDKIYRYLDELCWSCLLYTSHQPPGDAREFRKDGHSADNLTVRRKRNAWNSLEEGQFL